MRTIKLQIAVVMEVEMPEDAPISGRELTDAVEYLANDWEDGRYPYDSESMHIAAMYTARSALAHACRLVVSPDRFEVLMRDSTVRLVPHRNERIAATATEEDKGRCDS